MRQRSPTDPPPSATTPHCSKRKTRRQNWENLEVSFIEFVDALEEGGYRQDFLEDLQALETVMY